MTDYAQFQAVRKISKLNHVTILSARTANTNEPADCCIKLVDLDQAMIDAHDSSMAENLLLSSALQQAMGNKSEFWAPVYALDSGGTNAFYVGRLFPHSVQTLIDEKVNLTAAELQNLLLDVVEGLQDLEAAFHRSHGNLKPTNVLLLDRKVARRTAFLTDPDSSTEHLPSLTRTPDTKAIGEMLYALVTHKPYNTARWPLPPSDKWKELGSSGPQWFKLCETLLNTVSRNGPRSLDELHEIITGIRPTHRRLPKIFGAFMVAVLIAAAAYAERDTLPDTYHRASTKLVDFIHSRIPSANQHPASPPPPISSTLKNVPLPAPAVAADHPYLSPIPVSPPDNDGLKIVSQTPSPEFHSDVARTEFTTLRDHFAATQASTASTTTLAEWGRILAKIQSIDSKYPLTDTGSTLGWPTGLASAMDQRRDAALVDAIDAIFAKRDADAAPYCATRLSVQQAATAAGIAHDALARGDIPAAKKAIAQCDATLGTFQSSDASLLPLFAPATKDFKALADVESNSDRIALLQIASSESNLLAIRLAAWMRAGVVNPLGWPDRLAELAADENRADRLHTLALEAGTLAAADQIKTIQSNRSDSFFGQLNDQISVAKAVDEAAAPQLAAVVKKAPIWFQYDVALHGIRTALPAEISADQKKEYIDLSSQVDAPSVQLVRDSLSADNTKIVPTLAQSGPGSVVGWQLRPGWTRDHCTYVATPSGATLEFLRVHIADEADCYLCTTEAPVALMQAILNGDSAAIVAAEMLNTTSVTDPSAMHLWTFNDKTHAVTLDDDDYRRCFVVSPSDDLPAQFVTPQLAFYLARRAGCRLPTPREWSAAFNQAKDSSDANMKGFSTMGWKLRDRQFASLLTNPNRDSDVWPDDNIFLGNLDVSKLPRGKAAQIWAPGDLARLGGKTTSLDQDDMHTWPLSSLDASSGFGFRSVGDGDNFSGVFHDLIGNVAEYVMDAPVILAERVKVTANLPGKDAAQRVKDWFTPDHLSAVSVIGGSALSPPGLDPTKPYPLPATGKYADVGFRLAFTDPASIPRAQQALLNQAVYLTAPAAESGPATLVH